MLWVNPLHTPFCHVEQYVSEREEESKAGVSSRTSDKSVSFISRSPVSYTVGSTSDLSWLTSGERLKW